MILESARKAALSLLTSVPGDAEIHIGNIEDPEVWLGMGYCVGRGLATYRGDNCFQITPAGRLVAGPDR